MQCKNVSVIHRIGNLFFLGPRPYCDGCCLCGGLQCDRLIVARVVLLLLAVELVLLLLGPRKQHRA